MMRTSETIAALAEALAKAQADMKNAPLNKVNPHFKSKYADLASIREATIPHLSKHGLAIIQSVGWEEEGGKIRLFSRLVHASGEWIESVYPIPLDKPQVMGSAISYGRRYCWSAMCGIAADDDDDGNAAQEAAPQRQQRATAQRGASKPADERQNPSNGTAEDMEKAINAAQDVARINAITGSERWQFCWSAITKEQQKHLEALVKQRLSDLSQAPASEGEAA